jgi:futalosine hydrolase
MRILLVAATALEIQPLLQQLGIVKDVGTGLNPIVYKNSQLDLLITGIGMTATAYFLGKYLSHYQLILNAGIAGSFHKSLKNGTVVQVTQDCFSELGIEDHQNFLTLEDAGIQIPSEQSFLGTFLINKHTFKNSILNNLPKVKGITVNTVHGNEDSIAAIKNRLNPDVESMEGAAFFYACLIEKIPCAQIRAVSNFIEPRNRAAWDIPLAVNNLNTTLLGILNELTDQHVNAI